MLKEASEFKVVSETAIINFNCKLRYAVFLFHRKPEKALDELNSAFNIRQQHFPNTVNKDVLRGYSLKSRLLMGKKQLDQALHFAKIARKGYEELKEKTIMK